MPDPTIKFGANAVASAVSQYSRSVLINLLEQAGCPSCIISSTIRTPEAQARAMYTNIVNMGPDKQEKLYGPDGDAVIEEFKKAKAQGQNKDQIIAAMIAKINALGPSNVSRHCGDPAKLNVIDIAPISIAEPEAFLAALKKAKTGGTVSQFFSPGDHDPAFHIEIPQPQ